MSNERAWAAIDRAFPLEKCAAAVYRHYDADGVLLYVGMAVQPRSSQMQHARSWGGSWWFDRVVRITVEWYRTRGEAYDAKLAAIKTEQPLHNNGRGRPPGPIIPNERFKGMWD